MAVNIRLIARKELQDLLRDRRTLFLILFLPLILYPLFGLAGYLFALSLIGKPTVIGVVGWENLPEFQSAPPEGPPPGVAWPRLLQEDGAAFAEGLYLVDNPAAPPLTIVKLNAADAQDALRNKTVDTILTIDPQLNRALTSRDPARPTLKIEHREGDERAKRAAQRTAEVLGRYEDQLRAVRFEAVGLKADFHRVLTIQDSLADKPKDKRAADELRDTFSRAFPFILIMWLVAGAIQPAVDMTAGEKERGTMETLLISPASRWEIVAGKFLAVTLFSFGTVVWNVLWLSGAALFAEWMLSFPIISLPGIIGCVLIGIPQAMLFSALCLALGIFAKSTKEGQYYLMPLLLLTMPLAFYSMLPGAELSLGNFWIPVTGPMLLQARMLSVSGDPVSWWLYLLVFASSAGWVILGLGWAVRQFSRENVLFTEANPTKPSLWSWFRKDSA